jgi:hypothetical protein
MRLKESYFLEFRSLSYQILALEAIHFSSPLGSILNWINIKFLWILKSINKELGQNYI